MDITIEYIFINMNLQENIHRIQSVMGIINEDDKSAKIIKMIEDMGLMTAIKFFDGYDNIKNIYGNIFTKEYKIKFIQDSVQYLSKKNNSNGVSIYGLGLNPIPFGAHDDNELQQIEYFNMNYITIDIYKDGKNVKDVANCGKSMTFFAFDNDSVDIVNQWLDLTKQYSSSKYLSPQ
jgi:hypothetical protein